MDQLQSQHGQVITSIIKYGIKLRIHFQISTVAPLKFHPELYWVCDYLSMLGLKLIHVDYGAKGFCDAVYGENGTMDCTQNNYG